ncbi:3',5'-cyclic-nucleotide phosphodiesterase, partial [bacterium]|nr:3',5'-cyclic-nucleotide phosphodiesterase [bacterium]
VHTVGYIVERAGRVLVFSGDTATNDTLWDALNALPAVHKLIVDVSFPSPDFERATASKHYTVGSLAADLPKLKHDAEILISHNKPGCEEEIRAEAPKLLANWNYRFLERGEVIEV